MSGKLYNRDYIFSGVEKDVRQWSTGGRNLAGDRAGDPQSGRGRGWSLKFCRGRGTLNFAGAGAGAGGGL